MISVEELLGDPDVDVDGYLDGCNFSCPDGAPCGRPAVRWGLFGKLIACRCDRHRVGRTSDALTREDLVVLLILES